MIAEFKTEFESIATSLGATFVTKAVDELQDYVQGYDFTSPLINFVPIKSFNSNIGEAGEMVWSGAVQLQFLTKATVQDSEDVKDGYIDSMINLSGDFYRGLNRNTGRVFRNPQWQMSNNVLRFKTSNYCVGVESNINFTTSCNRI